MSASSSTLGAPNSETTTAFMAPPLAVVSGQYGSLIEQTATTALGLLQARRSLRVEWYIVILIVIEIFLTLYQMFVASTS
jgi:hypothetical protein